MIPLLDAPIIIHMLGDNMSLKSHNVSQRVIQKPKVFSFGLPSSTSDKRSPAQELCVPISPLTFSSKYTDALPQIIVVERV